MLMLGFSNLAQDVRYGFRTLLRNPGFAVAAILSLALGIGANSAVFSLLNPILFSSVPGVENPETLVGVWETRLGVPDDRFRTSSPVFETVGARPKTFLGVSAFTSQLLPVGQTILATGKSWVSLVTPFDGQAVIEKLGRTNFYASPELLAAVSEKLTNITASGS